MKRQEQPKNGRKLLYIIAVLLGVLFGAGCAGPQLTPDQVTQINVECNDDATCIIEATDKAMEDLLFQIEYDRQEKRDIERDTLCAVMQSCSAAKFIILYRSHTTRIGKGAHLDKFGECKIGKRDRLRDYQCISPGDLREAMQRAGY